jgi:hypothetical protein
VKRTVANVLLVVIAGLVYVALRFYSGTTSLNEGLGTEGPIYAAMVTTHDVQGGTVGNRLWPAFPLATAVMYAMTGSLASSFLVVDFVGLLLLVVASCLILDAQSTPSSIKVCAVMTLSLLGLPTATTAYSPAQPYLLGVGLATLGVAACEIGGWLFIAATQIAATLASPVGIIAPLYGICRSWRLNRRGARELLVFAPGLAVWLLIQIWARGGPFGLQDLLRFSRVRSDAVLWTEFAFMLFGAYFLITALGGLTILLWSRPRWIREILRERPELWALLAPVLVFVLTAGLEVPTMISFLIPFWLIVIGTWAREQKSALLVPSILAGLLTVLTQHPWVRMDDVTYFVDWFPYSVLAARISSVAVSDAVLSNIWRVRVLIAAGGLIAFAAWWRRPASWQHP